MTKNDHKTEMSDLWENEIRLHKEDPGEDVVLIPMEILWDPNLGTEEKGLLITLYSLPEDFDFSVERMTEILPDGEDIIRTAYRNLIRAGYVIPHVKRDWKGRYSGTDLVLTIPDKRA